MATTNPTARETPFADEGIARRRGTGGGRACPRWCSLSVPLALLQAAASPLSGQASTCEHSDRRVRSDARRRRDGSRGTSASHHPGAVPTRRHRRQTASPWDERLDRGQTSPSGCRSTRGDWGSSRRSPTRSRRKTTFHRPRPEASTSVASLDPRRSGRRPEPDVPAPMPRHRFVADIVCSGSSSPERAAR